MQRWEKLLPIIKISEGHEFGEHMSWTLNLKLDFSRRRGEWQQVNIGHI